MRNIHDDIESDDLGCCCEPSSMEVTITTASVNDRGNRVTTSVTEHFEGAEADRIKTWIAGLR